MSNREESAANERATNRLVGIAKAGFPVVGPADQPEIRVYGAGILARIVGTTEAMLAIAPTGRDADINILVRSAFEHTVTFAWIAADPEPRFIRWQKEDATRRLEADRDFQRFGIPCSSLPPKLRCGSRRRSPTGGIR